MADQFALMSFLRSPLAQTSGISLQAKTALEQLLGSMTSAEATAPVATTTLGLAANPGLEIGLLYQAAFNRLPDAPGFANWMNQYAHGESFSGIAAAFVNSPEFAAQHIAPDNGAFVTTLYNSALDRAPEAAGLSSWTNALTSGASRGDILLGIAESSESSALHGVAILNSGVVHA